MSSGFGGTQRANRPVASGRFSDGTSSGALVYWAHGVWQVDHEIGLHEHRGIEIHTVINAGSADHYDTAVGKWIHIGQGDTQVLNTCAGMAHAERVSVGMDGYQIWFDPDFSKSLKQAPSYVSYTASSFSAPRIDASTGLHVVHAVGGDGPIRSEVPGLSVMRLSSPAQAANGHLAAGEGRFLIAYVEAGSASADGHVLATDDAVVLRGASSVAVRLQPNAKLYCISLPETPGYPQP